VRDAMYYGDTLIVDLPAGKTEEVGFGREILEDIGPGLAAGLVLLKEYEADDPLVIGSGLLTGTTAPASSLGFVLGRSPLTGKPAVSPLSLFSGAEMKLSGFSMVVVRGDSPKPVYLWLHDGVADILDAAELWGRDTWVTTDAVRAEMGEHLVQVVSIGTTGEDASKLASYSINYWGSGDTAALGARMGEKKLKALALRGLGMLEAEEPSGYYDGGKELLAKAPAWKGFNKACEDIGAGDLDGWLKPLVHRFRSCFACPAACNTFVKYNEEPSVMESTDVDEPGMLVTGAASAAWLFSGGWKAEQACRAMEAMARAGMDLMRGGRELAGSPIYDPDEIIDAVGKLSGGEPAGWPGEEGSPESLFGPWAPPLAAEEEWLLAHQVGYVLGICPIYLLVSGLDTAGLFRLCRAAAGLELDSSRVAGMFS
jgi:aldehyde:ferredoxin oxidoreductase